MSSNVPAAILKQAVPHRKITYTYSRGTAKAQCSCGWQSKIHQQGQHGALALEKEVVAHKAK